MATEFVVTIAHRDSRYARQAADAVLMELDRLEQRLSRFVHNSDVARIAELRKGESTIVDPDTYDCLKLALLLERWTGGAFDVAYAMRPHRRGSALLELVPTPPTIRVRESAVLLDLGGIGKGFALDHMAARLLDWDVDRVLLRASASTVLAGRPPAGDSGWAVRFGPKESSIHLKMAGSALSGSGIDVKGNHIIRPETGEPAARYRTAWAGAPTAAMADGLSTAFMVMSEHRIREFCHHHRDVSAYVLPANESSVRVVYTPTQRTSQ